MSETRVRLGRPAILLDKDSLAYLKSLRFTWTEISNIMGVSCKTLRRRAADWGIAAYSVITDAELDEKVSSIKHRFPNCGEVMLNGHLLAEGTFVQCIRLRNSITRINRAHNIQVVPHRLYRRVYSVPGPNYLWHIDGNHKMIRYRLVVHGGVDGFSRLITYLKCSNNNRASTVVDAFYEAVEKCGIPSRIRSDKGGENVDVWDYMVSLRGEGRSSYITGSSVHNSRIERLWCDMYSSVTSTFLTVFHTLESEEVLDPLNDVDLFCLHYVYIPRINQALEKI